MQPVNRQYDYVLDHTNRLMICSIVSFWRYVWDCIVHWFVIFCVKHMHWFSQKLVCLKRKKCLFREGCTADCCFLCNVIHHLCCCIPWLMIMLFSWSTNLWYNYQYCWTCVQEELYLPVAINLTFFPIITYHIPPILLEYESICYGASTSLSLTIVCNGKKSPETTFTHYAPPSSTNVDGIKKEREGERGEPGGLNGTGMAK